MDERRKSPRNRTLKAGSIMFHRNNGGVDCWVRDLSPAGARLEVASQIDVPDNFVLWIEFDDLALPCHVIWRTVTRLGVKFSTQGQPG
jgi:hypothetical protein